MATPVPEVHRRSIPAFLVAAALAVVTLLAPITVLAGPHFVGWMLTEFQPDIKNGGRANTIAVSPADNDVMIVASESGGLFRSGDRGLNWSHVDSLPEFSTNAVAFLPDNPSVLIATVNADFRTANGGGIWRSTNGGGSWTHIAPPAAPAGVTDRFSAWEISIAADTGTIYVGNAYGVAFSTDQGATWTQVDAFGAGDRRVFSVAAQNGNRVLAAGPSGIRRSADGGATWSSPAAGPGAIWDMHALGRSPFYADQAYVVNAATELWYTEDAGDHWARIASAPAGGGACGGIGFVKPIGRLSWRPHFPPRRFVDLHFGNRCGLYKLVSPQVSGTQRFDYGGAWSTATLDHGDTRDLAFDAAKRPLLLGTDGGLHRTADNGTSWTFVGGGAGGYNALQITEVKGQWISDIGRYDMYFGTQDNNLWSSGDMGATWDHAICCEGFFIEMQRRVATAADSQITYVGCGACWNGLTAALFTSPVGWPNPPGPVTGNPKIVRKSFHVQGVDPDPANSFVRGLGVSTNLGTSWTQYASFPEDRRDLPKLSDPPPRWPHARRPVLYQAIRTGWDAARGFEINHLARIVKNSVGYTASVTYPAMNNFGGLGINPTMFAWYQVFAVDPGNSRHLIAPDVVNEKIMETWDGGDNWSEIAALTSQVTDGGNFQFRQWIFPLASAVSFSADDPNMVAIGTWQNGIFLSADRGATWRKIAGSEAATYITSLEWRSPSDIIVSTYGRGLWRVQWRVILPPDIFEKLCKLPCIFRPFDKRWLPDPPPERFEQGVLVREGRILGARAVQGRLKELFVSPGSSVAYVYPHKDVPAVKVTETRRSIGFTSVPGAERVLSRDAVVVGLALGAHGEIVGSLKAKQPLTSLAFEDADKGDDQPVGREKSPTAGKPYIELGTGRSDGSNAVLPGTRLELSGRNLPSGMELELAIDGQRVEKAVVGQDGRFRVSVAAPRQFGLHSLVLTDAKTGKVVDGMMVLVRHGDEEREGKREKRDKGRTVR